MKMNNKVLSIATLVVSLQLCGDSEGTLKAAVVTTTATTSGMIARAKATVAPYWHSGVQKVHDGANYVWERTPECVRTVVSDRRFKIAAGVATAALAVYIVAKAASKKSPVEDGGRWICVCPPDNDANYPANVNCQF